MHALLLTDGRVHRPFRWNVSLPFSEGGSGEDPLLILVEWSNQFSYEDNAANGNMNDGFFTSVFVPGFDVADAEDASAARDALLGLGGDYDGATVIGS